MSVYAFTFFPSGAWNFTGLSGYLQGNNCSCLRISFFQVGKNHSELLSCKHGSSDRKIRKSEQSLNLSCLVLCLLAAQTLALCYTELKNHCKVQEYLLSKE